jgi:hypothetical protein
LLKSQISENEGFCRVIIHISKSLLNFFVPLPTTQSLAEQSTLSLQNSPPLLFRFYSCHGCAKEINAYAVFNAQLFGKLNVLIIRTIGVTS